MEPRNRFPGWRAGTTTLFFVPARHATKAGGIDSWATLTFTNTGSVQCTVVKVDAARAVYFVSFG
jgi:hypothetical protein